MRRTAREILARLYQLPASEMANAMAFFGVCINVALLFATAVLAFYSYRQWIAVNDTLQEIKKQTPAVVQSGSAAESSARTAEKEAASSDATTKIALGEMEKQSRAARILANATQAATATAMRQLDLSERPSLVITDTKLWSVGVNRFALASYAVDVLVDNAGRSPATDTALISSLILPPGYSGPVRGEMMKVCHSMDKVGPLGGELVAQGEKGYRISRNPVGTEGGSLRSALKTAYVDSPSGNRIVSPILVVCVLYRSPISSQVHHTALMYDASLVFSADEAGKIESGAMGPNDIVDLGRERISLHKQEVLNGFVD
jgi:hypothetical protein